MRLVSFRPCACERRRPARTKAEAMAPKGEGIWTRRPLPCATWWIKSRVRWASRKQALQQLMKEAFLLRWNGSARWGDASGKMVPLRHPSARLSPLRAPAQVLAKKPRQVYHLPVFGIDFHGSAGDRAAPFCNSSMDCLSGERTNAMTPSRGGRLMVTPAFIRRSQTA